MGHSCTDCGLRFTTGEALHAHYRETGHGNLDDVMAVLDAHAEGGD